MKACNFAVVGGDARSLFVRERLITDGHNVRSYALCKAFDEPSLGAAISGAAYVICPTPFSRDGVFLNTPLSPERVRVEELSTAANGARLFAGGVTKAPTETLTRAGANMTDVLTRRELKILNAIPTAEGALKIAIESSSVTLHGSVALITGYGCVGKALARLLPAFGAQTLVTSRRSETDAEITAAGLEPINAAELPFCLGSCDFIFNTVPSVLIDKEAALFLKKSAVYIELASAPYGIDFEAAKASGAAIIEAPSLPGKTAPKTAARYMTRTVYHIIEEEGD